MIFLIFLLFFYLFFVFLFINFFSITLYNSPINIIETESRKTINQQEKLRLVSFKTFLKEVVAIRARSPKPTTIERVKNLFLNGLDLKQHSFERAVNI